ncbi:MAG TPA: transposase [Candidatus Acidoferrum sp.]|jgi:REP element-mobilizing transposase RayT
MSIPSRNGSVAGTYFVTSRTWESRKLFVVETVREVFVNCRDENRVAGEFDLHSFGLMPDHFDVLLTRAQNKTLERRLQLAKGGSAHAVGKARQVQFPVWQRGFSDRCIRDAADRDNHVRYIEQNPVRKRLVTAAAEFRWSSAFNMIPMDIAAQGLKPQERAVAGRHG